ncbi:hypothetical protein QUF99_15235 [Bacillus sp. DX4.1]|uniref:hypothetical protein n=1 Tax=Bacillus sp. DX4.1 TaxID=3055867 RepID=UPI0025A2FD79|nr:hypothetical protein [Bacillus sp. DX4.1]MDM5188622.1 hypothetical protein [Bacillus sp. DX4.1]
MKLVHLYSKETGAYLEDILVFPRYEESEEVYDIPENSTEIPLYQPNWKPVFGNEKWVETITQEELDEWNKPKPQEPSEFEELQERVEFLAKQVADLELEKLE